MHRRNITTALLSICAGVLLPVLAAAQQPWPNKPIKIIVPYAAGGQPDVAARALAPKLGERLGQPIVIENRPGAAGTAAYSALMQSQPGDGHAFILSDAAILSISPLINKSANYKLGRELVPVALIGRSALFLVAHPKTGVNNLQEFVAAVRKKPGEYTYASSGIGSNHHLTMEALKSALNLDIRHVPYRGSGQSTPALLSGQVDFSIAALPSIAGFVQLGQLKLLGANSATRFLLAPEVPPLADLVPGFDFAPILVVLGAVGTPQVAIDRLSKEIIEVIKSGDVVNGLKTAAVEPTPGGPVELTRELNREIAAMAKAAEAAQLKAE
jgi:tripartite-type tricarboxylate transporter receptor subunit TctC